MVYIFPISMICTKAINYFNSMKVALEPLAFWDAVNNSVEARKKRSPYHSCIVSVVSNTEFIEFESIIFLNSHFLSVSIVQPLRPNLNKFLAEAIYLKKVCLKIILLHILKGEITWGAIAF